MIFLHQVLLEIWTCLILCSLYRQYYIRSSRHLSYEPSLKYFWCFGTCEIFPNPEPKFQKLSEMEPGVFFPPILGSNKARATPNSNLENPILPL